MVTFRGDLPLESLFLSDRLIDHPYGLYLLLDRTIIPWIELT